MEFDEDWAKEPPKGEAEEERAEGEAGGAAQPPRTPPPGGEAAGAESRDARRRPLNGSTEAPAAPWHGSGRLSASISHRKSPAAS